MDLAQLNDQYDRLWTKAERIVEVFLDRQLAALESPPAVPTPDPITKPTSKPGRASKRPSSRRPAEDAAAPTPASLLMRETYVAVQCLKRIHEGRTLALTGGPNAVQPLGPTDSAKTVAEELSQRIRALCGPNHSNGDDEDPV